MKILSYAELLIKHEILKREDNKHLKMIDILQTENEVLRQCLLNEEKRTKQFRNSYRKKLNDYEDLERKLKNGENNINKKSNSKSTN